MRMCEAISKVRRMLTLLPHNAKLNLFKNQHSFQRQKVSILRTYGTNLFECRYLAIPEVGA